MPRRRPERPEPKRALCRERIPPDALARLHAIAKVQSRSVAEVLCDALTRYEKTLTKR